MIATHRRRLIRLRNFAIAHIWAFGLVLGGIIFAWPVLR